MIHIVFWQPQIPPNTGNAIRLCANTGFNLHVIHPLGFDLSEHAVRRAGMDYAELSVLTEHESYQDFLEAVKPRKVWAVETFGTRRYSEAAIEAGDALIFGPETANLGKEVVDSLPDEQILRIPMREGVRSLNLSNAAAVVAYDVWRRLGFEGGV
jgi:tRNA (cytidine/uridine-2'-O-)-methyltransferase